MAKEYRNVKILKFGNEYNDVVIIKSTMRIPKRAIRIEDSCWGDEVGKADNFKIQGDYLVCDLHLEHNPDTLNIVPDLDINEYLSEEKEGTSKSTSINYLEFKDLSDVDYLVNRRNLKGKELISSWKKRIMKAIENE